MANHKRGFCGAGATTLARVGVFLVAVGCSIAWLISTEVTPSLSIPSWTGIATTVSSHSATVYKQLNTSATASPSTAHSKDVGVATTFFSHNATIDNQLTAAAANPSIAHLKDVASTSTIVPSSGVGNAKTNGGHMAAPVNVHFDNDQHPKFLLKHLTKAGGTFALFVIEAVLPKEKVFYRMDDVILYKKSLKGNFVVATMRNPCDLYVSFAHMHSGKCFGYGPTVGPDPLAGKPLSKIYDKDLKRKAFKEWFLNARRPDFTGFYSFYFWESMLKPWCHMAIKGTSNQKKICLGPNSSLQKDLRAFSPKDIAHCWIFQETIMDDLRKCFLAYEQSSKWAAGSVNWRLFEHLAGNRSAQEKLFSKSGLPAASTKVLSSQSTRRMSCKDYFSSDGLEEMVRTADPNLFDKFGYHGCCAPSDHNLK